MKRNTRAILGGSAFFASILSIPIALRRQPYLAQHARGCAECQYQASVRSDSLAERSEFELAVPISKLPDEQLAKPFLKHLARLHLASTAVICFLPAVLLSALTTEWWSESNSN